MEGPQLGAVREQRGWGSENGAPSPGPWPLPRPRHHRAELGWGAHVRTAALQVHTWGCRTLFPHRRSPSALCTPSGSAGGSGQSPAGTGTSVGHQQGCPRPGGCGVLGLVQHTEATQHG